MIKHTRSVNVLLIISLIKQESPCCHGNLNNHTLTCRLGVKSLHLRDRLFVQSFHHNTLPVSDMGH